VLAIPHMALKYDEKRTITPRRVIRFNSKLQGTRAILVSDWLLFKKIFSSETA
jgi:hypothetical protein